MVTITSKGAHDLIHSVLSISGRVIMKAFFSFVVYSAGIIFILLIVIAVIFNGREKSSSARSKPVPTLAETIEGAEALATAYRFVAEAPDRRHYCSRLRLALVAHVGFIKRQERSPHMSAEELAEIRRRALMQINVLKTTCE